MVFETTITLCFYLQGLSSYAAFQQYPREVARLQEIEPKLAGGCTAVLALIVNDRLYVANAGDSRAVLARVEPSGTLSVEQLSIDHSVENEDELKRLEALGLDPKQLIRAGRLGMHENTRSIGDYAIKQGYKDVDTLRCVLTGLRCMSSRGMGLWGGDQLVGDMFSRAGLWGENLQSPGTPVTVM